jgi:hypothetical protein
MSSYCRIIPSDTELFPLTIGHNVNLKKLQAVLIVLQKNQLNSEMIWKIWKKRKLKSEMIWKIWKKANRIVKRFGKY